MSGVLTGSRAAVKETGGKGGLRAATLVISEIYRSLQGESTRAGTPCTLVRLTGCGLRCGYCDTAYAFSGGSTMAVSDIVKRVRELGADLVLITGGEPLEQENVTALMEALAALGATVMVETGGHVSVAPAAAATTVILDLKTPGSGMERHNRWENLELLRSSDEVKFVLTSREDYLWAREVLARRRPGGRKLHQICPVLFSPAQGLLEPALLAGWILEDRLPVRLNLQLHRILWPAAERGV
ncbi:MAG: radical SAM protein [Acidobacteria bacterium]|nr:radical SAM protein [Acidobacteriota bacterium]MCZ6650902.1 radical SAM protein [Acidobacteriota bacterium]